MSMRRVLVKKSVNAVITILIILVANFLLFRVIPGDPAAQFFRTAQGTHPSQELIDRQREVLGLNDPPHVQLAKYLVNTFTGQWGYSFFRRSQLVTDIIAQKAVWTLILVGSSTVFTLWIGAVIGAASAWRRGKPFDLASLGFGFFFYSMPTFWLGLLLVVLFHRSLGIVPLFPGSGTLSIPPPTDLPDLVVDALAHLALPAITLTLVQVSGISIIMRNSLIDVLTEDYIVTARATGASDRQVLKRHAIPNARLPMVTVVALNLAFVLGGAIQVETVFNYDGLGLLTVNAIRDKDYPLLQGLFLLITFCVVIANLVSDFVYAYLDPRIRLG